MIKTRKESPRRMKLMLKFSMIVFLIPKFSIFLAEFVYGMKSVKIKISL